MPDLVFMQIQTPNVVSLETLKEIKPFCGMIVNFTGDVRDPLPQWYIDTGKLIDLTLYVSMDDVERSREKGIKADWLQLGFDETIYNDRVKPISPAEIVFTANNYDHFTLSKERQAAAKALMAEFGGRFQLYGSGWTIPSLDSNASMEKQAQVFRGCKIALNYSNYNHSMYASDRILKLMGGGAMCLSHNFKDHDKLYKDGENIVIFNDVKDMIDKAKYYLENEVERKRIALNGYNLTHSLWTWDKMIENLLKFYK